MSNIMDYLYGPLSKNWCIYFYFFSIFSFLVVIYLLFILAFLITTKKYNLNIIGLLSFTTLIYILGYIQMRILYGMCINSSNPSPPKHL